MHEMERGAELPPGGEESLGWLSEWSETHLGLCFSGDRAELFRSRVEGLMVERRCSLADLVEGARSGDRATMVALAEALSTNHTYFFREPEILDVLRARILPALARYDEVRIWSAACSSGDEVYSLALLAVEEWGASVARERLSILGTDLSQRMVSEAELGIYSRAHLVGMSPATVLRHFRSQGLDLFAVGDELRALCSFRRLNLMATPWPFKRAFHVIFLRNVLYYFDAERRREILEACFDHAVPGGFLVTSLTEPLHDVRTRWAPVHAAIYRKPVAA